MSAEISVDLKERIIKWYLDDEYTMEEIVDLAGVSLGLVSKTDNLFRDYGQVTNPLSNRKLMEGCSLSWICRVSESTRRKTRHDC
ncbi:hypothetical protein C8R44DRAFT_805608 [Mycena epipterygia]|nr:hypothetical protein C8R44DRAFT_805608 [Mycena epipterygia]